MELCKDELPHDELAPFSVFARVMSGNSEFFAVWGNMKPSVEDNGYATLLSIRANKCRSSDLEIVLITVPPKNGYDGAASNIALPGPGSPLVGVPPDCKYVFRSAEEERLTRDFVKDAIARAIKAYGGDAPFKKAACTPDVDASLSQMGYIVVEKELEAYCAAPPARPVP